MAGEGPVGGFGVATNANIPGPAGMGQNPASIIDELTRGQGDRMALAAQAASPIAGGHVLQTPASLAVKAPNVYNPTPIDKGAVVGKKNARLRGIGATITGALNALGEVKTAEGNKKSLQLATDTQSLLNAQNGIDQAQEILKQDPNNADARKQLEHNSQVRNGLLSDDKFAKAVSKGFHIDFTDPKANDSPEHQAVQQGIKMHKTAEQLKQEKEDSGNFRGDAFSKGLPQQSQANYRAQAALAQQNQERKEFVDFAKAVIPAQLHKEGVENAEATRASTQLILTQARLNQAWTAMKESQQFKMQYLGAEQKNMLSRIYAEGEKQKSVDMFKINATANNPQEIVKNADESANKWSEITNRTQNQIGAYQAQLAANPKMADDQKKEINDSIQILQENLQLQQGQAGQAATYYTIKKQALGIPVGGSSATDPAAKPTPAAAITGYSGAAYIDSALPGEEYHDPGEQN